MKPREFWIHEADATEYDEKPLNSQDCIHVIEYSALEKANERIDKLRDALRKYSCDYNGKITNSAFDALAADDEEAKK